VYASDCPYDGRFFGTTRAVLLFSVRPDGTGTGKVILTNPEEGEWRDLVIEASEVTAGIKSMPMSQTEVMRLRSLLVGCHSRAGGLAKQEH
jgi:hypothetical protein